MKKIGDKQTVYVNLNKRDYVESASEDVNLNEEQNIFEKILQKIKNIF